MENSRDEKRRVALRGEKKYCGEWRTEDTENEILKLLSSIVHALAINLSIAARGDEEIRGKGGRRRYIGFPLSVWTSNNK